MAAKVGAPEFGTISRFSVLAKSDSDSSQDESVKDKNFEGKKKGKNAKKRARKKKKAAADSAAAGEVLALFHLYSLFLLQLCFCLSVLL